METAISIIVPVYNLEKYLPRCIDSILHQTFKHFELILINDGSTDNSGEICNVYAKKDKRIIVLHKENGGVAAARNAGLDIARGKYIGFVDNDDFIHPFMLEILYKKACQHASDITVCDFLKVEENEKIDFSKRPIVEQIQYFTNIEALHQLYTERNLTFVCPWNKLYRRELFEGLRYKEGFISDDETVAHHLLFRSNKITYLTTPLYYYVQRENSQSNQAIHIQKIDMVYALKEREEFFRKQKLKNLHRKALKHYMDKFFWYYYLVKTNLKNVDKELEELKKTFDKSLIHLLKLGDISWKQKVMCILFSISPFIHEKFVNTQQLISQHRNS
jgi:glycosyltransferase involved in cell wall biosynthesis